MSQRRLTPTEQTIVRPLLEHRAALQRELQATERGLLACLHALNGEIDQSLSLDPQTMVLTTTEPSEP